MPNIARPSVASLLLTPRVNGLELGSATGFVVEHDGRPYLITNWHVAAGRNPRTGASMHPSGGLPDELAVLHNVAGQLGSWQARIEPLRDRQGVPRWLEHPTHGRSVDVVALPLTNLDGIDLYPHDLGAGADYKIGVATGLSIVGFPFGLAGGGAAGIWVQGTIATEPELDYDDLPCFLIDSRTRKGQSGSPVLFYSVGGMAPMADGSTAMFAGEVCKILGVYSGRIHEESDLGMVWKIPVLPDILEGARRGIN